MIPVTFSFIGVSLQASQSVPSLVAASVGSRATRSVVEALRPGRDPHPTLTPAAERAARASYALCSAPDAAALDTLRETAIQTADAFTAEAADRFA